MSDLESLMQRMRRFGLPLHYREPEAVAQRVVAIVASRPRLAVPEDRVAVVSRWASAVRDEVQSAAPQLLDQLRDALLT